MEMVFIGILVPWDDFTSISHFTVRVTIKRTRRLVSTVTRRF